MQEELFGEAEIISSYTREQAIADGVLVDVTEWASAAKGFLGGYTCPVVFTHALWEAVQAIPESLVGRADVRGRAHDVLWNSTLVLRGALRRNDDRADFAVILPCRGSRQRTHRLRVVADGDGATIGFPEDF